MSYEGYQKNDRQVKGSGWLDSDISSLEETYRKLCEIEGHNERRMNAPKRVENEEAGENLALLLFSLLLVLAFLA